MNEVIKNTHAFVDVLCMARGDAVQSWEESTFQRALKWAQYFEEVHTKLKSKPALADKLNKYLSNFNKTGTVYLGNLQLTFDNLGRSKDVLKQCLLQNPHISSSQLHFVLEMYGIVIGKSNELGMVGALEKDLVTLSKLKGSLSILSAMRKYLSDDVIVMEALKETDSIKKHASDDILKITLQGYTHVAEGCTTDDIAIKTMSQLLFKYIQHHLAFSGKDVKSIHEKLKIVSTQEKGLKVIATCLMFCPDDSRLPSQVDQVQQFILNWLLGFLSTGVDNKKFWNLPPKILCVVSFQYASIFKLYLDHLISWGNRMIPVITCQSTSDSQPPNGSLYFWSYVQNEMPMNTNKDQKTSESAKERDFEALVAHFQCLTSGPSYITKYCTKALQSQFSDDELQKQAAVHDNPQDDKYSELSLKLRVNIWKDVYEILMIN